MDVYECPTGLELLERRGEQMRQEKEQARVDEAVVAEREAILQLIDAYRDELFAPGDWVGADQLKALDELARRIIVRGNK